MTNDIQEGLVAQDGLGDDSLVGAGPVRGRRSFISRPHWYSEHCFGHLDCVLWVVC